MTLGLKDLYYAVCTEADGAESYGTPKKMAGIKNIRTKSLGSNNKTNVVLATIEGLLSLKTPEEVAKNRGKSVEEVVC